ncbi:MAG: hypothetical protein H0W74_08120 [Sphingosinicella sp.]|nr:hypothetical protein [Sphingosinicella sp.]
MMKKKALIAALTILSACGERPVPATNDAAALPEPSGPPIVQQVERQDDASSKRDQGVRWESQAEKDGPALHLLKADGSRLISIACLSSPAILRVRVPGFSPIASEDRFAFGLGDEPVTLVANPSSQKKGEGVTGEAPIPRDFSQLLTNAKQMSALYGTQLVGPHDPPPSGLLDKFGSACAATK